MIFLSNTVSGDNRWFEIYNEAMVFYKSHKRFPTRKDNARLYNWATQWWRNSYLKNPSLLKEKSVLLSKIGFVYHTVEDRYDSLWMANYEKAKMFFEEHGHFPTMKEHPGLHTWARSWSVLYADKQPEKKGLLELVGYTYKTVEQLNEEQWMKNYLQCKVFFDEYGRFPEKTDNARLRNWVTRWWKKSADEQQDKAKMLAALGFAYKSMNDLATEKWMKNYEECKVFFEEHGHFPTYKQNAKLNSWARMWWKSTYLKNPSLHQAKADMLINIAFNPPKKEDNEQD